MSLMSNLTPDSQKNLAGMIMRHLAREMHCNQMFLLMTQLMKFSVFCEFSKNLFTGGLQRPVMINHDDVCYGVIDLVQGFHQVPVHEDSRDLLTVILP